MFASHLGLAIWLLSPTTEGIGLRIGPPVWTGACGLPGETCIAELPIVVENHRADRAVTVGGFDLKQVTYAWGWVRHFPGAPATVGPGAASRHTLPGIKDTEQTLAVSVWLRFASGRAGQVTSGPFVLTNPSREAAKQACKRDRGDWRRSISGRPYCVPRASDGGKTCRDGNECTGVCLFDRHEPVGPPPESWRQRQKWRLVGHCSEFVYGPSCIVFIPRGAASDPPANYKTPPPMVCSD